MKGIRRLLVLQHLEIEGPGLFEQFAKERDLKIEIIRLDNKNSSWLENSNSYSSFPNVDSCH